MEGGLREQVLHGSATATHAIRAALQQSQASFETLSRELEMNAKAVAKWRERATLKNLKTGSKLLVKLPLLETKRR